jgi:hypothetical protein
LKTVEQGKRTPRGCVVLCIEIRYDNDGGSITVNYDSSYLEPLTSQPTRLHDRREYGLPLRCIVSTRNEKITKRVKNNTLC